MFVRRRHRLSVAKDAADRVSVDVGEITDSGAFEDLPEDSGWWHDDQVGSVTQLGVGGDQAGDAGGSEEGDAVQIDDQFAWVMGREISERGGERGRRGDVYLAGDRHHGAST